MNIQQLRAQIAVLQDATMDKNRNFRSDYDEGRFDALTAVDALLDSLQEEPVSEDLESEIQRYYVDWDEHPQYVQTARHFAKWQKKQMMAKAITAHCFGFQGAALFSFKLPAGNYLVGSEVKVIVIKED